MSDTSLNDLHASADVVWDYEISGDLARRLDTTAAAVEGHVAERDRRKNSCGTHFVGYYADLWTHNIATANKDAGLLATRLREVARGVRDLEADARDEQKRIDDAKAWKRKRDERDEWDKAWEDVDFLHLFHGDAAPPGRNPSSQCTRPTRRQRRGCASHTSARAMGTPSPRRNPMICALSRGGRGPPRTKSAACRQP